ncbi:hypothetical protein LY78DRAFT_585332, partial [Colletotrichum sublineola]
TATSPSVSVLLDRLGGIATTLSAINNSLSRIVLVGNLLNALVLNSLRQVVDSLGPSGSAYKALESALAQAQTLRTPLTPGESVLLIQTLNNQVVQSYSVLLQELDNRKSQIVQASRSGGIVNSLLRTTDFVGNVLRNLNLTLPKLVELGNQLVKVLDPAYQEQGKQVTDAMQNLMWISIDAFQVDGA